MACEKYINNTYTVAHINARSLLSGFLQFRKFISKGKIDIFLIGESWLTNQVNDNDLQVPAYNFVKKNREDKKGGGVCVYIKNHISFNIINSEQYNSYEQLWIEIKISSFNYYIGVLYRPPHSSTTQFSEDLEEQLFYFKPQCSEIICMGDININMMDFNNRSTKKIYEILTELDLQQVITEPTRITTNSSSLIDVVICSNTLNLITSGVEFNHLLPTDHEVIFCQFKGLKKQITPYQRTYREFQSIDPDAFYIDLQNLPFDNVFYMPHIENKVEYFNTLMINLFDHHAPLISKTFNKPLAPWMTDNVKLLIKMKERALQKYKQTKQLKDLKYYKDLRNFTNTAIVNEKKAYLNHRFKNSKLKTIWKDVKSLDIYSKPKTRNDLPSHLADVNDINNFFIKSVKNITKQNIDETIEIYKYNNDHCPVEEFNFRVVDPQEVNNILCSIATNAKGTDGITSRMLKLCASRIIPHLTHIVNSCILESYFPAAWKTSLVVPVPKVQEPKEFQQLRPISIVPTVSKILEKVLFLQLTDFLNKYNILPQTQSGFRKHHSCTTALLHIVDDILKASDAGNLTVLILLDYTKAFDCINHKLLLSILKYIGLNKKATKLLENFITGRKQIVSYKNTLSQEATLDCGVPQGSILGPLLFSIYISQLNLKMSICNVHYYADDTQLYASFPPEQLQEANEKINIDLNNLIDESTKHSLCVNPKKTVALLFGQPAVKARHLHQLNLIIDKRKIGIVEEARNLGLVLDSNLRFKTHINNCIKKAFYHLKLIFSQKTVLNKSTMRLMCDTLVLSHFSFCDVVFDRCIDSHTARKIQRVQNSCTRLICGVPRRDHISPKIKEIGWLNMSNRRKLHSSVLYHKIIVNQCPTYLARKIRYRSDIHNINVRRKSFIAIPAHKTSLYKRSFLYNLAITYNDIAKTTRLMSVRLFKISIRIKLLCEQ